jgi:hypothetical protein
MARIFYITFIAENIYLKGFVAKSFDEKNQLELVGASKEIDESGFYDMHSGDF